MDRRKVAVLYDEYVVQPDLERTALLQLLLTICGRMPTLLYPGCSIHITPSFHFQHVVYVDLSELARKFFAQEQGILDVINHQKRYRQNPFVRFIAQDFTTALPLPPASFDVLLSLYAGGIARSCTKYVKPGGIVVTDDHHGDAIQATVLGDLQLAAVAEKRGQKIFLFDTDLAGYLEPVSHSQRRHSRNVSMSYIRKADYYVFRKLRDNGIGSAHKLR